MKPRIVRDGEQIRFTPQGVVLAAEYSRPATVNCEGCGRCERLRLIADEPVSFDECNAILTEHLESAGWNCEDGDVCPGCEGTFE